MNREEELIAENEALRVQLREMALDVLAASGQAQEAYEAQLAAEAKADRLRAEAEKIAAQRDEAISRVMQADDQRRSDAAALYGWITYFRDQLEIANREIARIRSDRQKEQQP
ncbi:hypothetical protein G5V65_11205 [Rhodobacter sp. HX-7-19]|uniref:Uncharacterized protein n=1 Tax=Paragemmobacter kunshanensis TaxID=2583234 RepID=A0A6M1U1X1_9RHOB|nr:hypothetical protein [Rhodobacter kunshanensis]NGQ91464.1 hypothetical protein [Rhodobacter kunshanensis]